MNRRIASLVLLACVADSIKVVLFGVHGDQAHWHLSLLGFLLVLSLAGRIIRYESASIKAGEVALLFVIKAAALISFLENWRISPLSGGILWTVGFGSVAFAEWSRWRDFASKGSGARSELDSLS